MGKNNDKCPTFAMYTLAVPGGSTPPDLTMMFQRAIEEFAQRYRKVPSAVVVSRGVDGMMDRAAQALGELGLGKLALASSGGCLAWEVWLQIPKPNKFGQAEVSGDKRLAG